jgi:hypothetical protein
MFFKTTLTLVTLLFAVRVGNLDLDQDRPPNMDGCTVIDKARKPQFIEYEGKSELRIRLHLRNNTSCAIVVETDDTYPTELKKLPKGGVTIQAVVGSRDGPRLRLHYLIQNRRRGDSPKPAYGWGDSIFTYEIPAGQSIVFDVLASHFKRRFDIAVPFGYSWEGDTVIGMGLGGVVHRVYFLFEDLPSEALSIKRQ